MNINCPNCNKSCRSQGAKTTLVGYFSPPGHDHDDNCTTHTFSCACGTRFTYKPVNKCSNTECDWVGKTSCFCGPHNVALVYK